MVIQVLDKAFDVVIAHYGTIQRVHTEVSLGTDDHCDECAPLSESDVCMYRQLGLLAPTSNSRLVG